MKAMISKKTYSLISDELLADNDDKEAENIFNKLGDVCGASMTATLLMITGSYTFAQSHQSAVEQAGRRKIYKTKEW